MIVGAAVVALSVLAAFQAKPNLSGDGSYATESQKSAWLTAHATDRILLVTDARENPIKRRDRLPKSWVGRDPVSYSSFRGQAQPHEFYVFQVSVVNCGSSPVTIRSVDLTDLPASASPVCLNTVVQREQGIQVNPGWIQPLWIGVESDSSGKIAGDVVVQCALGESGSFLRSKVHIDIAVQGQPLPDSGTNEGWRLSRLKWLLPSDLGVSDAPTKGYDALHVSGRTLSLTATRLVLDANGLPAQIQSKAGSKFLRAPMRLELMHKGKPLPFHASAIHFVKNTPASAEWRSDWGSDAASITLNALAEFDGFVRYRIQLKALRRLAADDIRLIVPMDADTAQYQLGLGFRGGFAPSETRWKWNVAYQQDSAWFGNAEVGAQWRLKGANYQRPLVNIYYGFQPLHLPDSWGNAGRGGVDVHLSNSSERVMVAYSGPRVLEPGETLEFNFDLLLTPSRPLNTDAQWSERYYHPNGEAGTRPNAEIVRNTQAAGANVLNVHQSLPVNPFINYPFNDFSVPDLKDLVDKAHAQSIRVKTYYTTRELTWQMPEIWALASFGGEIIEPGPGPLAKTVINPHGAHPTLTEALGDSFIPAWTNDLDGKYKGLQDLSVITRPDSAWTDYYLHGLNWMTQKLGVDGVYIDDTALDRSSLQRARRVLEANRPQPLIDLHSWNHEDPLAARGSSAAIYMDLFPYIDRIWFGEGFDYANATPDYWLVAMSGIPYGVMSEMLQGGGNVWRGMLFGETCRLGWSGDPRSMWQFWDSFGMKGTKMIGWWDKACPVKSSDPNILATVYLKPGKALIAAANWKGEAMSATLKLDWSALGLDKRHVKIESKEISGFQEARTWNLEKSIRFEGAKGYLIQIESEP